MSHREYEADCAGSKVTQVDIRTSINSEIEFLEKAITEYQEKLRIANDKLKLINKHKELEAYLNLDRMKY